jgi:hypothetical protein
MSMLPYEPSPFTSEGKAYIELQQRCRELQAEIDGLRAAHEPFVCPVCKADPCQTVWHDQACDYAPTDDGIAHVGGKGCIPKITRPSPPPGTALQALAKFGAAVIEEARGELGDLDGGWLQDKAVECGVLEPVTALAPCGDECRCAEYDDFPQECFQYPDDVRSALTKGGE